MDSTAVHPSLRTRRRLTVATIAAVIALVVTLFAPTSPANAVDPAQRHTISRTSPLILHNFYNSEEERNSATIAQAWATIPTDMKPYTALLVIAERGLRNTTEVKDWITGKATQCDTAGAKCVIQIINGETEPANRIPMAFWSALADQHSSVIGLNSAELYNAQAKGYAGVAAYVADGINLAASKGLHFIMSDTNLSPSYNRTAKGTLEIWLEDSSNGLFGALRAHPQTVTMINKESFSSYRTDALYSGLWLQGLIGNWGSSSDWWRWGLDGFQRLYQGGGSERWKDILQYPDALTAQSVLRAAANGGTVFKAEAAYFTSIERGWRTATYQYTLLPLFRDIIAGRITIPSKAEVLAETKVAMQGADAFSVPNYDDGGSRIFPKTGRYGIIPLIPRDSTAAEKAMFPEVTTSAQNAAYYDARYASEQLSGNTYLDNIGSMWTWMNYKDNQNTTLSSMFKPNSSAASWVKIAAGAHTYATFKESTNKLDVRLNNYRVNKDNLFTETLYGTAPGNDLAFEPGRPQVYQYIDDYLTVAMNANGTVNKNAQGGVVSGGGLVINDRSARDIRTTTFTVSGTFQGNQPRVTFAADDEHTRPYTPSSIWNASTKTLTLTIVHNGQVNFSIETDGAGTAAPTAAPFRVAHSSQCMDVAGGTSSDGAGVLQWPCGGYANQSWLVEPIAGASTPGLSTITASHSGKCLTIVGTTATSGADVEQRTCDGRDTQKWLLTPADGGRVRIQNGTNGLCAGVYGGFPNNGTKVIVWPCGGSSVLNDQWSHT